jgi:hypothetical protein
MTQKAKFCMAAAMLILTGRIAALQTPVNPDAAVLADFTARVKAYDSLRNKVDDGAAKLKESNDPVAIASAQAVLAERIRAARPNAKHGDIFTPDIRAKFLSLLRPTLKGREGAQTKATIEDEDPGALPLKVNAKYPDKEPLSTVPPNVLASLPKLPDGLEYRFGNKHLILLDSRANLIVDFIPNALL